MNALYLIRHGQASLGSADYDRLSLLGQRQALALGNRFKRQGLTFNRIICGTQQRHRQTAHSLLQTIGATPGEPGVEFDPGWNEFDFEGLLRAYRQAHPPVETIADKVASPDSSVPHKSVFRQLKQALRLWSCNQLPIINRSGEQGETWQAFGERITLATASLQQAVEQQERVMVITSGGVISRFTGQVLDLNAEQIIGLSMQIVNTSMSSFYFNRQQYQLAQFNDGSHLEGKHGESLLSYG